MSYGSGNDSGWRPSANKDKPKKPGNPKKQLTTQSGYGSTSSGWTPSSTVKKPKPPKAPSKRTYSNETPYGGAGSSSTPGSRSRSDKGRTPPGGGRGRGASEGTKKTDPLAWAKYTNITNAAARRARRVREGTYRGKYYGPDAFKGDDSLNTAWEKSGRKSGVSPRAFMARYNRGKG